MYKATSVRVVMALLFLMVIVMLVGCGNSQPADVLDDLVNAANDRDCEKISSLVDYSEPVNESGNPLSKEEAKEEEISTCRGIYENNPDAKDLIVNYDVLEERIDGESAYLKVETTTKTPLGERTETASIIFIKIDDQWRYTNSSPTPIVEEFWKATKENDCEKVRDLWIDSLANEKVEECNKFAGRLVSYRIFGDDKVLSAGIVLFAQVKTEVTISMDGTEKTNSVNQVLVNPIFHDWKLTEIP